MAATLLDYMRKVNRLMQNEDMRNYDEIAYILSDAIEANIYMASPIGGILGYSLWDGVESDLSIGETLTQSRVPEHYLEWLMRSHETLVNIPLQERQSKVERARESAVNRENVAVAPIYGGGRRRGFLIIVKHDKEISDDDLILTEYCATVLGTDMQRVYDDYRQELERKETDVQVAVNSLSYSEFWVVVHILEGLMDNEGLLIMRNIANRSKVGRATIVNAIRKLECAGVIRTKSLGRKGTYISVINEFLIVELEKRKSI